MLFAFTSCLYLDCDSVEKDAIAYSGGDDKRKRYLDSIASEPVYNIGIKNTPTMSVSQRNNLGLTSKEMNVTLEVSVVDVIRAMSNYNTDENARLFNWQKSKETVKMIL